MYTANSPTAVARQRTFNFDPYINYYDSHDNRHSFKFRVFNTLYNATTGDSTESTQYYYDYTFLRNFKKIDLMLTAGTNGYYSLVRGKTFADLVANIRDVKYYTTRDIMNYAAFIQVEKKFFHKLTLTGGVRLEFAQLAGQTVMNRLPLVNIINTAMKGKKDIYSPVTPLGRIGLNYQATEGTFIRGSFGQGFRYPALSEKYVYTLRSGALVFPNDSLRPENGWSAEVGIKQGVKISKWMAYFDLSGFVMRYHDMIEFQYYSHAPDSVIPYGIPFRAVNVTDARIMGVEFSAVANGKIFGVPLNFLIGYTFLDPRNLSYDKTDPSSTPLLKYRSQHTAKADIQANYKGATLGVSAFYTSNMKYIDQVGIGALKVVSDFRKTHDKGEFVMDLRAGYSYKDKATFMFICKNVLNTEYMLRPALIEAPRNYTFQIGYNF
jgi:iron complex outermembrane receptor protein